jgi:hypothetical protein
VIQYNGNRKENIPLTGTLCQIYKTAKQTTSRVCPELQLFHFQWMEGPGKNETKKFQIQ